MTASIKTADRIQYGFKRISPGNLMEQDNISPYRPGLRGERWVRACLKPQLDPCVPEEIAFLFEVARGSMVYGMFFWPLASLATEQFYRVLEAGARHRHKQLGSPGTRCDQEKVLPETAFAAIIGALKQAGKIPEGDSNAWETIPFLRNRYSHPKSQTIQSADSPVRVAVFTADLLNRLFK